MFIIEKQNGKRIGEYETAENGLINIPGAEQGWYVSTETQAPAGYILDETPKNVEMKANTPTKMNGERVGTYETTRTGCIVEERRETVKHRRSRCLQHNHKN